MSAAEEVLLNEPLMAPRSGYFSVCKSVVSPDNRLVAWTEDRVGRLKTSSTSRTCDRASLPGHRERDIA